MPEGPEVHCIAAQLKAAVEGAIISRIKWRDAGMETVGREISTPIPRKAKIEQVYPRGKRLIFVLKAESGEGKTSYLVTFLGMTGRWLLKPPSSKTPHIHLVLTCLKGTKKTRLYYDDTRKIGRLFHFTSATELEAYLGKFGVDLLTTKPKKREWQELCRRPKPTTPVYGFLLNPKYNSTVGNYLASEILYYACIHPMRPMGELSKTEVEHLRQTAIQVSRYAHSQGGLTIQDYLTPDGKHGGYKRACYDRVKKGDPKGRTVKRGVHGGRSYFYVPELLL